MNKKEYKKQFTGEFMPEKKYDEYRTEIEANYRDEMKPRFQKKIDRSMTSSKSEFDTQYEKDLLELKASADKAQEEATVKSNERGRDLDLENTEGIGQQATEIEKYSKALIDYELYKSGEITPNEMWYRNKIRLQKEIFTQGRKSK